MSAVVRRQCQYQYSILSADLETCFESSTSYHVGATNLLTVYNVTSARDCQELCLLRNDCVYADYGTGEHNDPNVCWLKDRYGTRHSVEANRNTVAIHKHCGEISGLMKHHIYFGNSL